METPKHLLYEIQTERLKFLSCGERRVNKMENFEHWQRRNARVEELKCSRRKDANGTDRRRYQCEVERGWREEWLWRIPRKNASVFHRKDSIFFHLPRSSLWRVDPGPWELINKDQRRDVRLNFVLAIPVRFSVQNYIMKDIGLHEEQLETILKHKVTRG